MNHYVRALEAIPPGETRSYMELSVLAGVPGAARAAGRFVAACPVRSRIPWHRVVRSDGRPKPSDRAELQWRRLRREGARPKRAEAIADWADRVEARFVGCYRTREYAPRSALAGIRWSRETVEPLRDEPSALSRGFRPFGSEASPRTPLPSREGRRPRPRPSGASSIEARLLGVGWERVRAALATEGAFRIASLLSAEECAAILWESSDPGRFERSIEMGPKGYGLGAYHYYREPLPEPLPTLRRSLYGALAPPGLPESLEAFWDLCRRNGQRRSSSILICYPRGGINHLHRDVYGPIWFPCQALVMLSKRARDFDGGEFVLESDGVAREIRVSEGDVLIFRSRPHRHGMRLVRRGTRHGIGLVLHLAE